MLRIPNGGSAGDVARLIDRRPFESPIGLKTLVPGWPHIRWGQSERGWVLLGSFAIALAVGLWTWGTWLSWVVLPFAFITHVASATDVVRQRSFPIYPSRTAWVTVAAALGLLVYTPGLLVLSLVACPGFEPDGTRNGFLINLWAYRTAEPREGQWVWMRPAASGGPRAAQVVAVSGQEVEWTGRNWMVDGRPRSLPAQPPLLAPPACRFKVPAHQILVEPQDDGVSAPRHAPLMLVSSNQVMGRAWAQFYPVWDRHLL
jgi:hypothetical protein